MTRDEIEAARTHLKAWFPNRSEARHLFNKICDAANAAPAPGGLATRLFDAQKLLEWNRAQSNPPIRIGFEMAVYEASMDMERQITVQNK